MARQQRAAAHDHDPQANRRSDEGQEILRDAHQGLAALHRLLRVPEIVEHRPVEEGLTVAPRREESPCHQQGDGQTCDKGRQRPQQLAPHPAAGQESRQHQRGSPRQRLLLEQHRDPEQAARAEQPARMPAAFFIPHGCDRPCRWQQHEDLAVGRVHVVRQIGRAEYQEGHARHHPAAVVREKSRNAQCRERHGHEDSQQVNGQHAAPEEQLGHGVVHIEKRRLVVDEADIQMPAPQQFPRAHDVHGLVDVQDVHTYKEAPGDQAGRQEQQEQRKPRPATV